MTLALDIGFSTSSKGAADLHVFLAAAGEGGSVDVAGDAGPLLEKAIKAGAFTAKMLSTLDIIVPVWDTSTGNGSNTLYHVTGFAKVRITAYQLGSQNSISAIFKGYPACGN